MSAEPIPPSALDGVRFGRIARHGDSRGSFRELWRAEAFADVPGSAAGLYAGSRESGPGHPDGLAFVQANLSTSAAGVLRGLHLHRRQLDHWVVASGRAFVALVDVRLLLLRTDGRPLVETRVLGADETVTIPVGVAHGFLALEALELIYFVTNEYDGSDELGFAWDDPAAAVPWPAIAGLPGGRPILSERDAANPTLDELVAGLRA
jgi:dTDP-4-dehydrorhamnose 3,5-epimerase